nr:MAG TPA: hypothetical protein [Caudoviricetes sp.]
METKQRRKSLTSLCRSCEQQCECEWRSRLLECE